MLVAGIDNGVYGAIALVSQHWAEAYPMPIITMRKTRNKKNDYDVRAIADMFIAWKQDGVQVTCNPDDCYCLDHVFLEKAGSRPHDGNQASLSTGRGFGLMEGILAALRIPYTIVDVGFWQARMFGGIPHSDPKAASILVAKRLFPNMDLRRTDKCRTVHDGKCDALLIAEYGRRYVLNGAGK